MTTFVTGATGFVGAAVVRALLRNGQKVRALARAGSDRTNLNGLDVEINEGELGQLESLNLEGCDTLYHVAADYRLWVPDPANMYRINVEQTIALLQKAVVANVKQIVYTSSVAVLSLKNGQIADENSWACETEMVGHYKRSKFLAELEVMKLAQQGLPVVIVNPSTPIGPGDVKPTPTGRMIKEAALGKMPAYVDTGLNLVHVDDVAIGHLLAAAKGKIGERYILGGDNLSLKEILYKIAALTGGKPPICSLPHNLIYPMAALGELWAKAFGGEPFATRDGIKMAKKKMFFKSDKAERELGYTHRSADLALKDAVDWFLRGN